MNRRLVLLLACVCGLVTGIICVTCLLREAMQRHGFRALDSEWWHFTLRSEPFPDTYFDFPVSQL